MHVRKHDVISDTTVVFPHLRKSTPFSCLTSIFKFRMQIAFQINLLPFSIAFIKKYKEMDSHQKLFDFSSNMAATINL